MSLPLLILRPIDGALATAERAHILGLEPVIDPMFEVLPLEWDASPADLYDALLLSSANAVKFGGEKLSKYHGLPVLAVGEVTANAAKAAGLDVKVTGDAGVQPLINGLAVVKYSNILRLAGLDHTDVHRDGMNIDTIAVYRSDIIGLGDLAQAQLSCGTLVALHSTRAAQILDEQTRTLKVDRAKNQIIAFSSSVAEAAGEGWKSVSVAPQPTDDALLSLVAGLCLD